MTAGKVPNGQPEQCVSAVEAANSVLARGGLIRGLALRRHLISLHSGFGLLEPLRVIHVVGNRVVTGPFQVDEFGANLCSRERRVGLRE